MEFHVEFPPILIKDTPLVLLSGTAAVTIKRWPIARDAKRETHEFYWPAEENVHGPGTGTLDSES